MNFSEWNLLIRSKSKPSWRAQAIISLWEGEENSRPTKAR